MDSIGCVVAADADGRASAMLANWPSTVLEFASKNPRLARCYSQQLYLTIKKCSKLGMNISDVGDEVILGLLLAYRTMRESNVVRALQAFVDSDGAAALGFYGRFLRRYVMGGPGAEGRSGAWRNQLERLIRAIRTKKIGIPILTAAVAVVALVLATYFKYLNADVIPRGVLKSADETGEAFYPIEEDLKFGVESPLGFTAFCEVEGDGFKKLISVQQNAETGECTVRKNYLDLTEAESGSPPRVVVWAKPVWGWRSRKVCFTLKPHDQGPAGGSPEDNSGTRDRTPVDARPTD